MLLSRWLTVRAEASGIILHPSATHIMHRAFALNAHVERCRPVQSAPAPEIRVQGSAAQRPAQPYFSPWKTSTMPSTAPCRQLTTLAPVLSAARMRRAAEMAHNRSTGSPLMWRGLLVSDESNALALAAEAAAAKRALHLSAAICLNRSACGWVSG